MEGAGAAELTVRYNWNWGALFGPPYAGWILSGLGWTVLIALCAWAIAFPLGSLLGIARTVRQPLVRRLAGAYVELFRNVPLLVQLFLFYFVLPELLPERWGTWLKRDLDDAEFWTATLCLGLYTAVRVCEQVRSGIESIPAGQTHAGLATGLSRARVYRHILLPVAYRIVVPALTSEFLGVFKSSSLALTIGVLELTAQTRRISEYTYQPIEMFMTATVLYAAVTLTATGVMALVERRTRLPGMLVVETSG